MAPNKRDGPTTCLIFLGIQIDTVAGELRLPEEKLQRLRTLLREWSTRKSCQRKQLESWIGLLTHACKVVRPGRSFLRRSSMQQALGRTAIAPGSVGPMLPGGRSSLVGGMVGHSCAPPPPPPPPSTSRWWRWHQTHLGHGVVEPGMAVAGLKSPGTTAHTLSPSQPRS